MKRETQLFTSKFVLMYLEFEWNQLVFFFTSKDHVVITLFKRVIVLYFFTQPKRHSLQEGGKYRKWLFGLSQMTSAIAARTREGPSTQARALTEPRAPGQESTATPTNSPPSPSSP